MKFGENLRTQRKKKDYSQEYLAERLNVSRQTISKWENSTAMPDLKKLTEIAELFEIGINELLGLDLPESESIDESEIIKVEYTSQRAQAQIAQLTESNKRIKAIAIINLISVILLVVAIVVTNTTLSTIRQNTESSLNMLYQQMADLGSGSASGNPYDDEYSDFTYEITSINKEKPWLVGVDFSYSPKKINKKASVYFTFTDYSGKDIKIEAEAENGAYKATKEIDCRSEGSIYAYIENGDEIEKHEVDFYPLDKYWHSNMGEIDININNSIISSEQQITWENVCGARLCSARLIFVKDGKPLQHYIELNINKPQPCQWFDNGINGCYTADIYGMLKGGIGENVAQGIELTDENNVRYVYFYVPEAEQSYIDFGSGVRVNI